jgi:hypothetical protein
VIAQLEAEGTEALPGLGRSWPLDPAVGGQLSPGFLPLSHVANATVVECNEGGEHLIYRTDEFGFNNPPGLVAAGRIDVAIVGESHALGHCVSPGRSTADLIRDVYPRTANFALADTRSIAQLASVREYVEPFQPGAVIWFVNVGYARATDERRFRRTFCTGRTKSTRPFARSRCRRCLPGTASCAANYRALVRGGSCRSINCRRYAAI